MWGWNLQVWEGSVPVHDWINLSPKAASLNNWDGHKAASPLALTSGPSSCSVTDGTDMMRLSAFLQLLNLKGNILMRLLQISHTTGTVINQMWLFVILQQWVIYLDKHYESCTCSRSFRLHISSVFPDVLSALSFLSAVSSFDWLYLPLLPHLHLFHNNPLFSFILSL